jgi:glucosamine-6-phosphate deaminase
MRLEQLPRAEDVAMVAADAVARAVAARHDARIVLPAGATPVPTYAEVVKRCRDGALDLSGAHLFQLDELVGVAPGDPRSFHSFLRTHLLDRLVRDADRHHLLDGASDDPAGEIARHAGLLADLGGADLALLGLGLNGHVAFNEPGSGAKDGTRVVGLHDTTRSGLEHRFASEAVPTQGMTLGLREVLASRQLVLIVTGAEKAGILDDLLGGGASASLPASHLLAHPALTILADAEASPVHAPDGRSSRP